MLKPSKNKKNNWMKEKSFVTSAIKNVTSITNTIANVVNAFMFV